MMSLHKHQISAFSKHCILYIAMLMFVLNLPAQTAINTSFEIAESYSLGSVHNINRWKLTTGSGMIVSESDYVLDGSQAMKISAASTTLQLEHIAYPSNAAGLGLGEVVYADFYVKLLTLPTTNFALTGYDLASSNHRSFMLEFLPTSKIKIYDGSSGWDTQPAFTVNTWIRISVKINNGAGTYQLAINAVPVDKIFVFREIRNSATIFDFHSLRFTMSAGTCNVAVDKLYVGTEAPADVSFSGSATSFNVNIQQPLAGSISLSPQKPNYQMNDEVTATLTLPGGYDFLGWTGDLAGTDNPRTFLVQKHMTIGATVSDANAPATVRTVTSAIQFKEALNAMNPGDTIMVMDGTYNPGGLRVTRGGTSDKPIIIKSKNLYGARITGKSSFTLSYVNHCVFEGFDFNVEPVSTIFKMEGCSYVRITRNKFMMQKLTEDQSSKWITIGDVWENPVCNSHHNRIDHNLFDGKYDAGAWLVIDGSHGTVSDISKYDRIDHNIFRNNTPRVANEKETIRIGVSDLSMLKSYTIVENNLFEDCDGDPEIVSVKSCNNIIRENTFRRCLGTLSLRHGHNSVVSGNFFFGDGKTGLFDGNTIGCGGVRVYGLNHQVYNNYFEGLTGSKWDAAITITNGDVANSSTSLTSHFLPENVVFANNTLINNQSDIEIGFDNNGSYSRAPKNCRIINNLIVSSRNPIVKYFSTTSLGGVSFENNIMHATGTSSIGLLNHTESQLRTIDPLLELTHCRAFNANCDYTTTYELYRLSNTSPAIDASIAYDSAGYDMDGQPVVGIRDIGADEFNPDVPVTAGPVDEMSAGPNASDSYAYETYNPTGLIDFQVKNFFAAPNPFRGTTILHLPESVQGEFLLKIYTTTGFLIHQAKISENTESVKIDDLHEGLLICVLQSGQKQLILKLISEKKDK